VLSRRSSDITQMARDFGAPVGAHDDDAGIALESSCSLFLLGMIIMSVSIISMVIFACGHYNKKSSSSREIPGGLGRGTSDMAHVGMADGMANCGIVFQALEDDSSNDDGDGGNGNGGGLDAKTGRSGPNNNSGRR